MLQRSYDCSVGGFSGGDIKTRLAISRCGRKILLESWIEALLTSGSDAEVAAVSGGCSNFRLGRRSGAWLSRPRAAGVDGCSGCEAVGEC